MSDNLVFARKSLTCAFIFPTKSPMMQVLPSHFCMPNKQLPPVIGPSISSYSSRRVTSLTSVPALKPPLGPRMEVTYPAFASLRITLERWLSDTLNSEAISLTENVLSLSKATSAMAWIASDAASEILRMLFVMPAHHLSILVLLYLLRGEMSSPPLKKNYWITLLLNY